MERNKKEYAHGIQEEKRERKERTRDNRVSDNVREIVSASNYIYIYIYT